MNRIMNPENFIIKNDRNDYNCERPEMKWYIGGGTK